jgi:hypothetical protein
MMHNVVTHFLPYERNREKKKRKNIKRKFKIQDDVQEESLEDF